jgi:imidazolonepropionase-like amidohydrolase
VFSGGDPVIDRASVFVRNGRIERVVAEGGQLPTDLSQFVIVEGAGKTLMPGLIDVHTHLGGPPVVTGGMEEEFTDWPRSALNAYLYCGVIAVKSVGDATD